jgi:2-succinyl-5-enolpyruvyl-6-hydroxy-3-cyclohexene-1-carboxylate synthase
MAKRQTAARNAKSDSSGTAISARVALELGRISDTYDFEKIAVATDDPKSLSITLSNSDGTSIKVMLPRAEVRKLLTWRMIMSL